jgi:hypothetical protein
VENKVTYDITLGTEVFSMAPAETPDQAGEELIALATERFGDLSEAQTKLLRALPKPSHPPT